MVEPAVGSQVIAGAIRGDADAVRAVWQANRRWVAAILLAHKPREAELEDLLQDVAMTFVGRVGELREPSALRPWLRTVAINAAHACGRKATVRRRDAAAPGEADPGERPAAPVRADPADLEQARRLMDLAQGIPEGYREPLLLRCVRGMSYERIGELMGLPATTIETRIARGRKMLRELAYGARKDGVLADGGRE